ncbi:hypothetical protein RJ640_015016, partial [Escallonia rubra]
MKNLRTPHLDVARKVMRYVKGSLGYGLMYKMGGNFLLSGFSDADWAGDENDQHSTTNYCFSKGPVAICWCSDEQIRVALSSTKAEYIATTMATQECIWLKRLINDIYKEVDYALPIHSDNKACIALLGTSTLVSLMFIATSK